MRGDHSVSLTEIEGFKLEEFQGRWMSARIRCLQVVLGESSTATPNIQSEVELLTLISPEQRDVILRAIFDTSRAFSLSAARYFRVRFELQDFSALLSASDIPCISGRWQPKNSAFILSRRGCEGVRQQLAENASLYCDYWREALDGLVMGLGEYERFTRHSSYGHGDSECLDILYSEADEKCNRFAEIPFEVSSKLAGVQERFLKQGVSLTFDGLSEGTLYFRMLAQGRAVCGAGGRLFQTSLIEEIRNIFPGVALQDVSPLAVYGEKA